jgi:hypothetical protein
MNSLFSGDKRVIVGREGSGFARPRIFHHEEKR